MRLDGRKTLPLDDALRITCNFFRISPLKADREQALIEARKTIERITSNTKEAVWKVFCGEDQKNVFLTTKVLSTEIRFLLGLSPNGGQKKIIANKLAPNSWSEIDKPLDESSEKQIPEKPQPPEKPGDLKKFNDLVEELLDLINFPKQYREEGREVFMRTIEKKFGDWYWGKTDGTKGTKKSKAYYFCRYSEKKGPTERYIVSAVMFASSKRLWKKLKEGKPIPKGFPKEDVRIIGEQRILMKNVIKVVITQTDCVKKDPDSDSETE